MNKLLFILSFFLFYQPTIAAADTIILKDGTKIETQGTWEQDGKIVYFKDSQIQPGIPIKNISEIKKYKELKKIEPTKPTIKVKKATKKEARDVVYNSAWDGSVRQVKDYLQEYLNDPKSFDAIEWSRVIKLSPSVIKANKLKHTYAVRCKFRAKNMFGGYIIQNMMFYLDENGNVVSTK